MTDHAWLFTAHVIKSEGLYILKHLLAYNASTIIIFLLRQKWEELG